MNGRDCDIAIIGGGLAGGLIALALAQRRPGLVVRLLEAGPRPGGNHRWSWFATDLPAGGEALLAPIRKTSWEDGYDVIFPSLRRHLPTPYRSMASADFAAALDRELAPGTIVTGCEARAIDAHGVDLRDGRRITAHAVIDCRGFAGSSHLQGGWQVFMGRALRTDAPHGVERPIIMDAAVAQLDGYRFVYVLPLGTHDLFVEDTYYQDTPLLDRAALGERIDAYCRERGWHGSIEASETGVLPVITGGDFEAFQREHAIAGVATAGARAGPGHPLTSYTLPFAVATALEVAERADLSGDELAADLAGLAQRHWLRTGFYRLLGTMLFGAARPPERYRVFERFYRLPEPLIARFYAARSTIADKVRILVGKPPVSLPRALRALAGSRPRLQRAQEREL